eukprot:m51a1_g8501 hypothetical protein (168) ;mRNA; r:54041-55035
MSSRTELIFAAFQGPVLSVGTTVVHMFRSYTAELLLPRRWRLALGFCAADIVAALQRATVRVDASLSSPPLRCASCGDVVVLSMARMYPDGLPDDLESYCATMRSNCSSSRRHLHTNRAIIVRVYRTAEGAQCGADVCSKYRRNAIPNAFNRDIEGLWQLIARIRNW